MDICDTQRLNVAALPKPAQHSRPQRHLTCRRSSLPVQRTLAIQMGVSALPSCKLLTAGTCGGQNRVAGGRNAIPMQLQLTVQAHVQKNPHAPNPFSPPTWPYLAGQLLANAAHARLAACDCCRPIVEAIQAVDRACG